MSHSNMKRFLQFELADLPQDLLEMFEFFCVLSKKNDFLYYFAHSSFGQQSNDRDERDVKTSAGNDF